TGLAIDAVASGDQAVPQTTVSTGVFSTGAVNELLVAFVSADDITAGNTVTGVSGANLTWVLVRRTNTRRGTSEIWRASAPAARTLGPNQTLRHQYMPPVGDTYWVQGMTGTTPQAGTSVTINDIAPTGDQYNLSICEIVPAVQ